MRTVELKFVNTFHVEEEDGEPIIDTVRCARESVELIMRWYGAYYAGDPYRVYRDGIEIPKDQNGEKIVQTIDVLPTHFITLPPEAEEE